MRILLALAGSIIATASVPLGAADGCNEAGGFSVCTFEEGAGGDGCESPGYEYGYTFVAAGTPAGYAGASGIAWCENEPSSYEVDGGGVLVYAGSGESSFGYVSWYGYEYTFTGGGGFEYCESGFYTDATGYVSLGCPAGAPPNPGWGNVLP